MQILRSINGMNRVTVPILLKRCSRMRFTFANDLNSYAENDQIETLMVSTSPHSSAHGAQRDKVNTRAILTTMELSVEQTLQSSSAAGVPAQTDLHSFNGRSQVQYLKKDSPVGILCFRVLFQHPFNNTNNTTTTMAMAHPAPPPPPPPPPPPQPRHINWLRSTQGPPSMLCGSILRLGPQRWNSIAVHHAPPDSCPY